MVVFHQMSTLKIEETCTSFFSRKIPKFQVWRHVKELISFSCGTGSVKKIWDPLFISMREQAEPCGRNYFDIMLTLGHETDKAFRTNNMASISLLLTVYGHLFKGPIPFIRNERIRAVLQEIFDSNLEQAQSVEDECADLTDINKSFATLANHVYESLQF